MRHIAKGAPDDYLLAQHQRPPKKYKKAKKRWLAFRGTEHYEATRTKCLVSEQFGLCCYSEVGLITGITQKLGVHLEHIEPRVKNPPRTFDHSNLIASAIDDANTRNIAKHEVFGGHFRGNWFNLEDFIHPLLPECQEYFHFEVSSGHIVPSKTRSPEEQEKAQLSLDKLNLNSPLLVKWRYDKISALSNLITILSSQNNPELLRELARKELLPDKDTGLLKPFHSAACQLFGRLSIEIKQTANWK